MKPFSAMVTVDHKEKTTTKLASVPISDGPCDHEGHSRS